MSVNYSLETVLAQAEYLIGKSISIDAVLVIKGYEAYLVESTEKAENSQRIPVHCPGLESELDLIIGGWMGSSYSYIDPVKIKGKLEIGTVKKNRLALSDITELTIIRDDELIRVFSTSN